MATQRQKILARVIVENATLDKPLNAGQMLEKAGYDKTTASATPKRVINAPGVQEELEVLGFTVENAKSVVKDIMLDTEADRPSRLKAADMVFKVKGTYAPEKHELKGELTTDSAAERAAALAYAESIRASLNQ